MYTRKIYNLMMDSVILNRYDNFFGALVKNHPEKLHVYKNDSLLVVLNQIYVSNKEYSTNGNVISLFRRQRK